MYFENKGNFRFKHPVPKRTEIHSRPNRQDNPLCYYTTPFAQLLLCIFDKLVHNDCNHVSLVQEQSMQYDTNIAGLVSHKKAG